MTSYTRAEQRIATWLWAFGLGFGIFFTAVFSYMGLMLVGLTASGFLIVGSAGLVAGILVLIAGLSARGSRRAGAYVAWLVAWRIGVEVLLTGLLFTLSGLAVTL